MKGVIVMKEIIELQTNPEYTTLYLERFYVPDIVSYSVKQLTWLERLFYGGQLYLIVVNLKNNKHITVSLTQNNIDILKEKKIKEV